jgi:hypothetical protein
MTRDAFLQLLARAARDKSITEEEAARLLRRFDAGELQVDESEMPLPPEVTVTPADEGEIARAMTTLLTFGALSFLHRKVRQMREMLQDDFQIRGATLARRLAEGGGLRRWQGAFREAVVSHIIQQRAVGSGRIPAVAQIAQSTLAQSAFISRWADSIALKMLVGEPPSYFQLAARSALYAGAGRAEGFRAEEEDTPANYVVDYESRDDGRTCEPCLAAEAESPFLPGEGKFPGEVCDGHGYCRCVRVARLEPRVYAALRRAA